MAGSSSHTSKGVPRNARNPQRKARRARNLASQPERKLRHMLKRNSIRDAFTWANEHSALATLRQLAPDYQEQLRAAGHASS